MESYIAIRGSDTGRLYIRVKTFFLQTMAPQRANASQLSECGPCRSELARDGLKSAAFNQLTCVIVNDHREQARSYNFLAPFY